MEGIKGDCEDVLDAVLSLRSCGDGGRMTLLYVEVRGCRVRDLGNILLCKVAPVETIRVRVEYVRVSADVV